MYFYPPEPGGLATQGDLMYHGLQELGVEVCPVHLDSHAEKDWYYRWFKPDVAVGVGYWGHTPQIILHPLRGGVQPVPWLVADGYIANYRDVLNNLPLLLVTSSWVKEVYTRDGINPDPIEILPVGCDTMRFVPRPRGDPKVEAVRTALGVAPDEIMVLTVGGDAASKGGQEVMQALALIDQEAPPWKYVCKVWPQLRTQVQTSQDKQLVAQLGIGQKVVFSDSIVSRNFMPYLMAACDIYAAPSRLEGFGMPMIEAGSCEKPVLSIKAMAMLDTLVHGETAFLAEVAQEVHIKETMLGRESGYEERHRVVFDTPRIADYRASVTEIADYLLRLMRDEELRRRMGTAGRARVVEHFDYRAVASRFVALVSERLGIA